MIPHKQDFAVRAGIAAMAVLAVTVAVSGWRLVLEPVRAENAALRHRTEAAAADLRLKAVTARSLALEAVQVSALERIAGHYAGRLGLGAPAGVLLETLTDVADLQGVEIVRFTPRGAVDRGRRLEAAVDVTVQGDYHDVARLVDAIGTPPALASLSDIHVAARAGDGGRGSIVASFVASVHAGEASHDGAPIDGLDGLEAGLSPLDAPRYHDEGRRDPFGSLIAPVMTEPIRAGTTRVGLAGVSADDVAVRGIVRHGSEMLAILETPARQSFVVRPKDRLSDSSVLVIDAKGVVFARAGADGVTARVTKPISRHGQER